MSLDPCICPHFNQNHGDLDDDKDDYCDEDNFYNNDDVGEKLPCSLFLKKGNWEHPLGCSKGLSTQTWGKYCDGDDCGDDDGWDGGDVDDGGGDDDDDGGHVDDGDDVGEVDILRPQKLDSATPVPFCMRQTSKANPTKILANVNLLGWRT